MSVIRLPIDTKSLHYNIKNDNKAGHTATVATPLKQGKSYNKELARVFDLPSYKNFEANEALLNEINKNARIAIKVLGVFVLDKFSVNGIPIDCDGKQYSIYVREETDPSKAQYGRIKVHYPLRFKFIDTELNIDNNAVINAVSAFLKNYAFLVTAFEYDTETQILNFRATLVGEPQVPYSKVFVNEKGVGNKFAVTFTDIADNYDYEIFALRKTLGEEISPVNYNETMERFQEDAMNRAERYILDLDDVTAYKNIGIDYPYAPFDIEYIQDNITKYALVFFTATNTVYFSMPAKRIGFCNAFADYTTLLVFTSIATTPQLHIFTIAEANRFTKSIASIVYTKEKTNE